MRYVTNLMDKLFSDSTPESFGDELSAAIQKAMSEGQYSCEIDGTQYNFADCGDGSCVIEDKSNKNELTLAKENAKGETVLKGVEPAVKSDSATLKDVMSPRIAGEDGNGNLPASSTQNDVDVTVEKTAGIVDPDKAGVGKALQSNYSLCIHGFDSEEEAQEFYSDLTDELSENINFSDEELENVAFSATELNKDVERLMGTEDLQLAYSVLDEAEYLKAYSVLAADEGHDVGDLYEMCSLYSDYASEMIGDIIANTDVNEYFSELDEDEINEYFSELDEVTSNVLYSALTDEEDNYTFSEVQEICDQIYSDLAEEEELGTPVQEAFSEFDEDELNEYFSQFNEVEQDAIFSVLEEDENATFSDLNEALSEVNVGLNELFSDVSEEELDEFCENFSDDELDVLQEMIGSEDNYTYSDFMSYVNENRTYSEDDLEIFAENMNQLYSAVSDLEQEDNVDLASDILMYSTEFSDIADELESQGHDISDVTDMLVTFAEKAVDTLDKAGVDPATAIENAAKKAEAKPFEAIDKNKDGKIDKEEWEKAKLNVSDFNKADANKDGVVDKSEYEAYLGAADRESAEKKAADEPKKVAQKDHCGDNEVRRNSDNDNFDYSLFDNTADGSEQKLFSLKDTDSSINSFLDTPIN